ncbi:hypothetical protein AVEN_247924-1 [Araneus ventricosus]|uniref:Uncharacterized protein n=1 Tax=Araneus ventricosus TaxID=182803 RepID=A0A4Y2CJW4_ARAVE|nr:hypothetical protein AVEN_247924-1 [Araneus ventricosus]
MFVEKINRMRAYGNKVLKRLGLKEYLRLLGKVSDNICWKKTEAGIRKSMDPEASLDHTSSLYQGMTQYSRQPVQRRATQLVLINTLTNSAGALLPSHHLSTLHGKTLSAASWQSAR